MKPLPVYDEREQVIRSLQHGRTARECAEIYSRSEHAIRKIAKKAGIKLIRYANRSVQKEYRDLALSLPAPLHAALTLAAKRRDLEPDVLAIQILHGVIAHGSIHRTLAGFAIHHNQH
jgi:hypothetical protein